VLRGVLIFVSGNNKNTKDMKAKKTTAQKITTLVFALAMTSGSIFGQQSGSVWVKIPSASSMSITGEGETLNTSSDKFNTLIETYNVQSVAKAFPSSRNAGLQEVYELSCSCDENDLLQAVAREHDLFVSPEIGPRYEALFTPDDYFLSVQNDYALNLIKAQDAWNYTTGSSSVVVGITDTNFDPQHEELQGKFTYMTSGLTNSNIAHGTAVAITVGGSTNNSVGKSSVGYNSRLQLRGMNYDEILAASYTGAKIINASWVSGCTFSQYAQDVITEAYNNGSLVVASAGNGTTCGGASNLVFPAAYEHVLAVTSVGPQDNHQRFPGNPSITHQHNASVDICAPGYDVAISSASGSYISGTGSSYASAYVSGTAALILSVNPCLTPENITYILKSSADDIYAANPSYIGMLGTGRLNAHAAIELALTFGTLVVESSVITHCETTEQTVVLDAVSGDAPFTAVWTTGENGMELSATEPGVYGYTVTDANGCIRTGEVILDTITLLSYSADLTHIQCNGENNGSIDLTVTGGNAPYSYSWDNGAATEDLTDLGAGIYRVLITDASGCSVWTSFEIIEPSALVVTAVGTDAVTATTGMIDATVEGGVAPYVYNWSNGSQTEDLIGLNGGEYTLNVSDANGCTASVTIELNDHPLLEGHDGNTTSGTSGSDAEATSTAGVEEETAAVAMSVYPNPTTDYIRVVNGSETEVTVVILDQSGRMLAQTEVKSGTQQISFTDFANGTYFVKGSSNGKQVFAEKVLKM
jgi:hypothetical protein